MSEPSDELTPLPEPTNDKPRLSRSPYLALGVAAIVVSTAFATVATLASSRGGQAAPTPQSDGTVETSTADTYTTNPDTTSAPDSSKNKKSNKSSAASSSASPDDETTSEDGETTSGGGQTTTTPGQTTTPKPPPTSDPPPNRTPVADFNFSCTGLKCDFDGGGSADPDGSIASYSWSFGGSGVTTSHTFDQAGTFDVTLTVIDNRGKNATQTKSVTVNAPTVTSGN